jgi:hypothetical protein
MELARCLCTGLPVRENPRRFHLILPIPVLVHLTGSVLDEDAPFGRWEVGGAGKLLTGNIGSLCEQQPLKALRAPCGPIPQYKMLYY